MKLLDLLESPDYTHKTARVQLKDGKAVLIVEATRRTTDYENRELAQRMTLNGRVPASDVFAAWRAELETPLYARAEVVLADVYAMDIELYPSRESHHT